MKTVRPAPYVVALGFFFIVATMSEASGPATPHNFRCASPPTSAQINLAWDMAPPDGKTEKPMQYRLSYNGKILADDLNALNFKVIPSMISVGAFQLNTPLLFKLQSVDEYTRTPGNLPTTSKWTELEVWIQNPKTSSVATFCRLNS